MVVLHQCRHEDDGRYRFLVPVEKVPAEIPVQTASIVPDFSNAEGPKVTADCFFGVPDHDHHHCPGLVVGPVELRLPESDGCEVDAL